MASSQILWQKNGSDSDSDVWDDRLLIKEYEKSSRMVTSALQASGTVMSDSSLRGNQMKPPKKPAAWKLGHFCRCTYTEDGVEYEAQLIKLTKPNQCRVRYLGYNNEEDKEITELKPSGGNEARLQQKQDAEVDEMTDVEQQAPQEFEASTSSRVMPPPPPSFFPDNLMSTDDDESLASMLMSWYMSGYHTGYYKAMKQFKSGCGCKQHPA